MILARIQSFCKVNNIDLGSFNEERAFLRLVTERNKVLCSYNNHFCLVWKQQDFSFNQAAHELKANFKLVDNFITEPNVNCRFKYEVTPKKRISID